MRDREWLNGGKASITIVGELEVPQPSAPSETVTAVEASDPPLPEFELPADVPADVPVEVPVEVAQEPETEVQAEAASEAAPISPDVAAKQQHNEELRRRAQRSWENVVEAKAAGTTVLGFVTTAVKGGLLVDVGGIRGFLPASQVRLAKDAASESLVRTRIPLKILDVEQARRRIIVSHRRAVDEERRRQREELLGSLEVGQVREVVVARLADFGAFVDLGGVDGLIPIGELALERVEKPSDAVNIGDRFMATVLRIDEGGRKIALSRKSALPDPWRDHAQLLRTGTACDGTVVAKEPRLAIELAPGIVGNVRPGDADPADYEIGEQLEVVVRNVDRRTRRITLALPYSGALPTTSGFAPLGEELSQKRR
jgi:small subunit ribosomal protein S1